MKNQRVLPYIIETLKSSDTVTAWAGLPLVLETMLALGVGRQVGQHVTIRERERGYSEARKIESLVMLMASGGECIEDIERLRQDKGLCRLVGDLAGADALRTFLYAFHDDDLIAKAQASRGPGEIAYIPEENEALQGLGRVNVNFVRQVAAQGNCKRATLDHDATIQESHKRDALFHYKGGRGYQPSVIYWAEQDLVLADEYRDGNVPAAMDNLRLIQRGFAALPATVTELFFRSDTACYEDRVLKWLANPKRADGPQGHIGFTIGADMTQDLRKICEAAPAASWQRLEDRPQETVYYTEVEFTPGNWSKDAEPLRYLAVRIDSKQRELLEEARAKKYLAVVTNRDGKVDDLLHWHWKKAGTIELVHDVAKNELGARVPPCGRFGANAAWFRISLLTYNVLSAMKSCVLPAQFSDARPKRLRFSVFTIAGRIISRGGKLILRVAQEIEAHVKLVLARQRLAELAVAFANTA
jgi:hypothetical protein